MDDKVLVIKVNHLLTPGRLDIIHKSIESQIKSGVVVLPCGCEVIVVPKDIEIRLEEKDECSI